MGDTGIHRRLGDGGGDGPNQAGVERCRDDVVGSVAKPATGISGGDLVRHVLAGEPGQGLGRGDLHRVVDRRSVHVEGATKDVGEAQDVVDLVRVVGARSR